MCSDFQNSKLRSPVSSLGRSTASDRTSICAEYVCSRSTAQQGSCSELDSPCPPHCDRHSATRRTLFDLLIIRSIVTAYGYKENGDYEVAGDLQDLDGLREGDALLLPEGDRHVEKVYDHHEDQKDNDVENDDVDVPGEPPQPVDHAEGAKELGEIAHNRGRAPLVYHLKKQR